MNHAVYQKNLCGRVIILSLDEAKPTVRVPKSVSRGITRMRLALRTKS